MNYSLDGNEEEYGRFNLAWVYYLCLAAIGL